MRCTGGGTVLICALSLWFLGSGCGSGATPGDHEDGGTHQVDAGHDTGGGGDGGGGLDGGGGTDAGPAQAHRILSETSGGARLQSASYRLELFVAPVRPVGTGTSSSYKLQLGPGAVRNAR